MWGNLLYPLDNRFHIMLHQRTYQTRPFVALSISVCLFYDILLRVKNHFNYCKVDKIIKSRQRLTMTKSRSITGLASWMSLPRLSTSDCFCCKADRNLPPRSFKALLTDLSVSVSDGSWEPVKADISTPSILVTQTCTCGPFDDAEESLLVPLLDTRSPFISLLQDKDFHFFTLKSCTLSKNSK